MPKSVVIRKHRRRRDRSSPIKAGNETDEEDSGSDSDEHYRRKYSFLKKMAKTMIYVSE